METGTLVILAVGVLLIALACAIIPYINLWRRYRGYSEVRRDAAAIAHFLSGQTFRDMNDLVVTGNTQGYRTTLRFSRDENTPGVNIRMEVPGTFDVMIVPKDSPLPEGGQVIRTGNDLFDAKWTVRTTQPTQARIFIAGNTAISQIRKLCCSSKTFINLERGALELSELTVPDSAARHLIDHMESMAVVAKQLALMPGAGQIKIQRVTPPRPTNKLMVAVIVIVAFCTGITALANHEHAKKMNAALIGAGGSPQGIPADEALHIPHLQGWRLAGGPDFDPKLVSWLRSSNGTPTGRLEGDFTGGGIGNDHAYLLMNSEGAFRLVVLLGTDVKFDNTFPNVALMAKVPKTAIRDIKIDTGSPATGNADGILVVKDKDNLHSGLVLSFNGGSPITAVPENYKSTTLE